MPFPTLMNIPAAIGTRLPFLALATLVLATSGGAMIIRHDIADAAYLGRESDYPALFALYRNELNHRRCVATIIAPRWAVTAAHCIAERVRAAAKPGGPGFEVEIGGRQALIEQVIAHPGTGAARKPDIALLRMRAPVNHVAPYALYRASDEMGRIVLMPGWGSTGNGVTGDIKEDGLFRVAENRVDRIEGGRLFWTFDDPRTSQNALTLEGISGGGDSGQPALIRVGSRWAVAGVSSGQRDVPGRPAGSYGVEESFVRVSEFAPWIDQYVNGRR